MSFAFRVEPGPRSNLNDLLPAGGLGRKEIDGKLASLGNIAQADFEELALSFSSPYPEVRDKALHVAAECVSYRPGILAAGEAPKYSRDQRSAIISALELSAGHLGQFPEELTQALCEASRYADADRRRIVTCLRGQLGALCLDRYPAGSKC